MGSAPPVALSSASVYPEPVGAAFELGAELGYDGVELMVWSDAVSQDVGAVGRLADRYGVPVLAVHAPCLAVTQRVWGSDPIGRIRRSVAAAATLGARTVVLHPPFRWQRRYAAQFADEVARAGEHAGVALAVENMFPITRAGIRTVPYRPGFDPTEVGHAHYTLDLSHAATAGSDALAMLDRMGDALAHVHLSDSTGSPRDEHLVPGHGGQPCAEVCERLTASGFGGVVVVEVSTRRCRTRYDRAALLAESLLFARLNLRPADDRTPPSGRLGHRPDSSAADPPTVGSPVDPQAPGSLAVDPLAAEPRAANSLAVHPRAVHSPAVDSPAPRPGAAHSVH